VEAVDSWRAMLICAPQSLDMELDLKCAGDVGVAGGVTAWLGASMFCISILAGRRRISDSGGVDKDSELTGTDCFLEASVNDSGVQRLMSN